MGPAGAKILERIMQKNIGRSPCDPDGHHGAVGVEGNGLAVRRPARSSSASHGCQLEWIAAVPIADPYLHRSGTIRHVRQFFSVRRVLPPRSLIGLAGR